MNGEKARLQTLISEEAHALLRQVSARDRLSIGELLEPIVLERLNGNRPDAMVFETARRAIVDAMNRCSARQRELKDTLQKSINAIDAAYPPEY